MNLDDPKLLKIFNDLTELLQHFDKYITEYKKDGSDVVGSHWDVHAEAFNILLVITKCRDAMLIQSFEGYNTDANKMIHLEENIKTIMYERYIKLETLIENKYKLDSINLFFERNCVWIYQRSIQKEVDEKKETHHIYDILRYGCELPDFDKIVFRAMYKCNDHVFIGVVSGEFNLDHIKYLYNCLEKYKPLANTLNQKVSLDISFS